MPWPSRACCSYEPVTVNSMLAVVNTYCRFAGLNIKVKFLRIQWKLFREESKELTKNEYEKLIPQPKKRVTPVLLC